jgi:plastocyanin domain-containing protein
MKTLIQTIALIALVGIGPTALAQGGDGPTNAQAAPLARIQRVDVSVTKEGFVPASTRVKVGQAVTLVVTRKVEKTCAKDIVVKDFGITRPLPLNEPVEVTFTPTKAGRIRFACAMDMIAGEVVAE